MGVLIVLGTIGLMVAMARRSASTSQPPALAGASLPSISLTLPEPEGTRITAITAVQDRLAILVQGGGADRVILVDPHSGAVTGRISVSR